jgi:hypothetical protein
MELGVTWVTVHGPELSLYWVELERLIKITDLVQFYPVRSVLPLFNSRDVRLGIGKSSSSS